MYDDPYAETILAGDEIDDDFPPTADPDIEAIFTSLDALFDKEDSW